MSALVLGGNGSALAEASPQRSDASYAQSNPGETLSRLEELLNSIPERSAEPSRSNESHSTDDPAVESQRAEEPIKLLLRLEDRRVYVYKGEEEIKSYPVAIGRPGWETPTGEFSIKARVRDPGWTNPITNEQMPPGPDNPLGDRWMAFWTDGTNVIGFHGTPNRDSIGNAASHGCVRMYNEHARELFEMVAIGTPVIVE